MGAKDRAFGYRDVLPTAFLLKATFFGVMLVASQAAGPMVRAGKTMWNEMTNANCTRDRNTGSRSNSASPFGGAPVPSRSRGRDGRAGLRE
jgi:hypothetical protein